MPSARSRSGGTGSSRSCTARRRLRLPLPRPRGRSALVRAARHRVRVAEAAPGADDVTRRRPDLLLRPADHAAGLCARRGRARSCLSAHPLLRLRDDGGPVLSAGAVALLAIARAVETATLRHQVIALAAIAAALLTRVQSIVLLAVFAFAILVDRLLARERRSLRAFWPVWSLLLAGAAVVVAKPGLFGAYAGTLRGHYPFGSAAALVASTSATSSSRLRRSRGRARAVPRPRCPRRGTRARSARAPRGRLLRNRPRRSAGRLLRRAVRTAPARP